LNDAHIAGDQRYIYSRDRKKERKKQKLIEQHIRFKKKKIHG
jgi:hypothetical protein